MKHKVLRLIVALCVHLASATLVQSQVGLLYALHHVVVRWRFLVAGNPLLEVAPDWLILRHPLPDGLHPAVELPDKLNSVLHKLEVVSILEDQLAEELV